MKRKTKIRFPGPQLALVKQAYPHCTLDGLTAVTFEFDQAGNVVTCLGAVDPDAPRRDYTDAGLAVLYVSA